MAFIDIESMALKAFNDRKMEKLQEQQGENKLKNDINNILDKDERIEGIAKNLANPKKDYTEKADGIVKTLIRMPEHVRVQILKDLKRDDPNLHNTVIVKMEMFKELLLQNPIDTKEQSEKEVEHTDLCKVAEAQNEPRSESEGTSEELEDQNIEIEEIEEESIEELEKIPDIALTLNNGELLVSSDKITLMLTPKEIREEGNFFVIVLEESDRRKIFFNPCSKMKSYLKKEDIIKRYDIFYSGIFFVYNNNSFLIFHKSE